MHATLFDVVHELLIVILLLLQLLAIADRKQRVRLASRRIEFLGVQVHVEVDLAEGLLPLLALLRVRLPLLGVERRLLREERDVVSLDGVVRHQLEALLVHVRVVLLDDLDPVQPNVLDLEAGRVLEEPAVELVDELVHAHIVVHIGHMMGR